MRVGDERTACLLLQFCHTSKRAPVGLERAPALLQGRGRERAPLLSALPMERQLCAGNRDDLGNLQGARMWQPRDSRGAPAGASPPRHSQHCCRYGPRQHCSFHRPPAAPDPVCYFQCTRAMPRDRRLPLWGVLCRCLTALQTTRRRASGSAHVLSHRLYPLQAMRLHILLLWKKNRIPHFYACFREHFVEVLPALSCVTAEA